jgi:hypothetical protein
MFSNKFRFVLSVMFCLSHGLCAAPKKTKTTTGQGAGAPKAVRSSSSTSMAKAAKKAPMSDERKAVLQSRLRSKIGMAQAERSSVATLCDSLKRGGENPTMSWEEPSKKNTAVIKAALEACHGRGMISDDDYKTATNFFDAEESSLTEEEIIPMMELWDKIMKQIATDLE